MSLDLYRKAARHGPGYKGRREFGAEERQQLLDDFVGAGIQPPPYLQIETEWVDRRAKLFEAGDYPDKGVTATRETLVGLAKTFDLPVPILIEHAQTPLQIGYLTQVEVIGDELFGEIALSQEANALIDQSEAHSLSVGLDKELTEIREVSLVRTPRIATARIFSGVEFAQPWNAERDPWREKFLELEAKNRQTEAARKVSQLVKEGRLTPAQVPFAVALMETNDQVQFDGQSLPVARLFEELLERQPKASWFGEVAPSPSRATTTFLPEEADFYQRHFPDLSLDQIAAKK
ncbi:MAG: hypothetical protein ABL949_11680 [Fimbriimonadaceae bacterium]